MIDSDIEPDIFQIQELFEALKFFTQNNAALESIMFIEYTLFVYPYFSYYKSAATLTI